MEIKDLKRSGLLFGYFFEDDYSYDVNKGKFFNEVKKCFKKENLLLLSDPRIGDNMVNEKNSKFKITTFNKSLHFENNSHKDKFISEVIDILNIHNEFFDNSDIKKIGFIQYFDIISKSVQSDFLKESFFRNLPDYETPQIDFHLNFKKVIKENQYNFNLNMKHDKLSENISGSLDMNISKTEEQTLNQDRIQDIFEDLEDYYVKGFITDFFRDL